MIGTPSKHDRDSGLAVYVVEAGCRLVLVLGAGAGADGVACICEGVDFRIFFPDSEAPGILL